MKVLVVSGGIGSGKSVVCSILKERYGIPVYEADLRAKQLYVEVPEMLDDMETKLGVSLRNSSGEFVPSLLAEIIFNDSDALRLVEDMLFPVLMKDFADWAERQDCEVVAFESATVLEKQQFEGFGDLVLLIAAPVQLRLSRAMERDKASREKIQARISLQSSMNMLSDGHEDSRVDFVLKNDSSFENLELHLKEFMEKYSLTKML
jgi:dephospho-CoA kinase